MRRSRIQILALVSLLIVQDSIIIKGLCDVSANTNGDEWNLGNRNYSGDADEASCVCGLNRDILDKIQAIVSAASKQDQPCNLEGGDHRPNEHEFTGHSTQDEQSSQKRPESDSSDHPVSDQGNDTSGENSSSQDDKSNQGANDENAKDPFKTSDNQSDKSESLIAKLTEEIKALESQLAASLRPHNSLQSQQNPGSTSTSIFTSIWRPSQQQQLQPQHQSERVQQSQQPQQVSQPQQVQEPQQPQQPQQQPDEPSTTPSWQILLPTTVPTPLTTTIQSTGNNNNDREQSQSMKIPPVESGQTSPTTGSFIQGLPTGAVIPPSNQQNFWTNPPNQNGPQSIQTVQSTLVTTVPNVVSNIFTNIQDLAIQTERQPDNGNPSSSQGSNYLTSIDGSSVHLSNNETADGITAQGEMLFLQWIDHQIQALHMTASMASYIRRSSLSLFRRIVRQYVERIGKLGGRVEDNVRRATQTALNNTQNLISFLLRNYLNFAGGLMQIIGEQVSRVGKQLDSTGETIAHINLNPFDIVSNVLQSLPNPSRYSEYFRAFGKYLIGETQQEQSQQQQQQQQQQQEQQSQIQDEQNERRKNLISKTMGALSKTLGIWLG